MLDRDVYLYAEIDRLVGLRGGTARRWINGYKRDGRDYAPILRPASRPTEWATWGEFVEARILAEYRDKNVPTARLREAVASLRQSYGLRYPLAHLRPYLAAEGRDVTIDVNAAEDGESAARSDQQMVARTRQMLLSKRSRDLIDNSPLAEDERGEKVVGELAIDPQFPDIVISPGRYSGQPTFAGRRVSVATIAGMVAGGERVQDLAADYNLSLAQVRAAVEYANKHKIAS